MAVIEEAYLKRDQHPEGRRPPPGDGDERIYESQVSRLWQQIDERVGRILEKPLSGQWPYLWLDDF